MQQNGSPEPVFDFDEERTWFQVMLPIHPAFKQKLPFSIDIATIKWNIQGINRFLNQQLEFTGFLNKGDIAGDIAEIETLLENQSVEVLNVINRDIASGITAGITRKMINILDLGKSPKERKDFAAAIGLVNNVKNFNTYIAPLINVGWLIMTIPNKPTSPKQQYLTTLKGRLILEFLNRSVK